jgi:hypothetical protein
MTKEQYFDLQEDYIQHILDYVKETGGLFPHISILADIKKPTEEEKDKPALIHIPIDNEFMEDEESKDKFVDDVLPILFSQVKKKFEPKAVAWASEAWMRVVDKDFDPNVQDWKALPIKKEIIIITIESEYDEHLFVYEIKRLGKQVNSEGEMVDMVELEKLDDEFGKAQKAGGRFSGLLKKFKD